MVKLALPRYIDPKPIRVSCLRCPFVAEAPVEEAHAAFAAHTCAQVVTVDNGSRVTS